MQGLTEEEAGDDPIALFGRWFEEAHDAGIYLLTDDLALADNDLHHNQAGLGGGAYLTSVPGGELTGNRLYTNTADYGAGLYLILSDGATLTGNYIYDNQAAGLAGGLDRHSHRQRRPGGRGRGRHRVVDLARRGS